MYICLCLTHTYSCLSNNCIKKSDTVSKAVHKILMHLLGLQKESVLIRSMSAMLNKESSYGPFVRTLGLYIQPSLKVPVVLICAMIFCICFAIYALYKLAKICTVCY